MVAKLCKISSYFPAFSIFWGPIILYCKCVFNNRCMLIILKTDIIYNLSNDSLLQVNDLNHCCNRSIFRVLDVMLPFKRWMSPNFQHLKTYLQFSFSFWYVPEVWKMWLCIRHVSWHRVCQRQWEEQASWKGTHRIHIN